MSAGFTPGPWSFHAFGNPTVRECPTLGADYRYADYCIGSGNMMIADVRLAFGGGEGGFPTVGDEAEFTANAHLIAAAPDLFEALELHAEWPRRESAGPQYPEGVERNSAAGLRIHQDWFYGNVDLCAQADKATSAALAKARGEA